MRILIKAGSSFRHLTLLAFALLASSTFLLSQTQASGNVALLVDGTSNIHDWDIRSDKGICQASYQVTDGVLTSMATLSFSIKAETLKSGKSAMDKNTYKALGTDKYPNISFTGTSSSVRSAGGNSYTVTVTGRLTISSVTKPVTLVSTCTLLGDQSLKGSGSYALKMTDFSVTPPSIMFGAIKTGDKVTIRYDFNLKSK